MKIAPKPVHSSLFSFVCFLGISVLGCKSTNLKNDARTATSQWEKVGPGGGGSTFIPTFSYQNANDFFIKCDMTGSYLTHNGGNSYQQFNHENGSSCFAFDPSDPNTLYIGSDYLSQSKDGGKTWIRIFPKKEDILKETFHGDHANYRITPTENSLYPKEELQVKTIKVDPFYPKNIYFSMGAYFFYSTNKGKTWSRETIGNPIDNIFTNKTTAKNEVYIFTTDTIFIFSKTTKAIRKREIPKAMAPAFSFTAGNVKNTVTQERDEADGIKGVIFYALHHDVMKENAFVFVHSEIWTSIDMGLTWKPCNDTVISNANGAGKPSFTMIACAENDAANAYIVSNNYEEKQGNGAIKKWYGALKTGDSGNTWQWVWKGGGGSGQYRVQDANDAANLKDSWVHKAFGGEFIQLIDVGVAPQDGNIAIVTDWYRTMKTTDGGKTWNEIYSIANADGSFTSRGTDVTTTYSVHFDPFDKNHIGISYTDIGYHHSFDGGKSWFRATEGIPNEWTNTCYSAVFDPSVKGKIWSVWSGIHDIPRGKMTRNPLWKESEIAKGGIAVSIDGGKTWKPTVTGMGDNSPATSIVIDPKSEPNNRTLYASVYNKGVFKSIDDGKTWVLKNKGIDTNTCTFELTLSKNGDLFLTVSPTPIHKGGKKGGDFYSGAVYKSTSGAENWVKLKVSDGLLFPNGIEIDPTNPNRIYLACWADIDLADLVGGDVVRSTGGDKLLEMPGGVFLSEDGGTTWTSIFDKKQYIYDVTADPYHLGRLYCCTFNKAAYRSDDFGKTWRKIKGYDFHWGHRIVIDENDHEKVYITTFGSSVWHGMPEVE